MIFPRYHQWDAVLKLEADAKANGAGQSYLIQHSAGSGKSNTIAWTAHRLSNLHDASDTKVFDKVIVITDRVDPGPATPGDDLPVRARPGRGREDRQGLRTNSPRPWPVSRPGSSSPPSRSSRSSSTRSRTCPTARYAVIVDEAHSSQTGEAAKDLRLAARCHRRAGTDRCRGRGRRASSPRPSTRSRRHWPRRSALGASRRTSRSSPSPPPPRPAPWRCSGT